MKTRVKLLAGNWKMHKTHADALAFAAELATLPLPHAASAAEAVICAPATALFGLADALAPLRVGVGAQHMHEAQEGAFTGEVSATMLLALGCRYVILGHSERRAHFAETDGSVAKKTVAALDRGLTPIVCVGETLEQRESGRTATVIRTQAGVVLAALRERTASSGQSLPATDALPLASLVVAYEPVWAIGTGRSSSAQDAQEVALLIRELIRDALGPDIAQQARILYGGSVKPDNIGGYVTQPDIDGALVGGASLNPESFAQLWRQSAL
ncbi:MAG: triose-phosphate isomerase [Bacilli bacterium]